MSVFHLLRLLAGQLWIGAIVTSFSRLILQDITLLVSNKILIRAFGQLDLLGKYFVGVDLLLLLDITNALLAQNIVLRHGLGR